MSEPTFTKKDTGRKRPTCAARRKTRAVMVVSVQIGGDAPVEQGIEPVDPAVHVGVV